VFEEGLADEFAEELKDACIVFERVAVEAIQTGGLLHVSIPYWSGAYNSRPSVTWGIGGSQKVVSEETFADLQGHLVNGEDGAWALVIETFQVPNDHQCVKVSAIFMQDKYAGDSPGEFHLDFHTRY